MFETTINGRLVKGIATMPKTCSVFMFDRQTGVPLHPIVETAVPTETDVPGEEVWPTQPMPYTSNGTPQQPFCTTYSTVSDPALAKRVRQTWQPFSSKEFVILSPGQAGGPNYGSPSFSPATGLIYVSGKNTAFSLKLKPVGSQELKQGRTSWGHIGLIAESGPVGMTPSLSVGAYDPVTGQQVWNTQLQGATSGGNLSTAGGLVFQGTSIFGVADGPRTGSLVALDARTGKQVFSHTTASGVGASPLTFQVNGKQYVSAVAGDTVVTFALP
jgi:quinoprotein glucose dehydrogenase